MEKMGEWGYGVYYECARSTPRSCRGVIGRTTLAWSASPPRLRTGDEARLRERMIAARAAEVPPLWVEELLPPELLECRLSARARRVGVWRSVAGPPKETGESIAHPDWERWTTRGAQACGEVYGRTFPQADAESAGVASGDRAARGGRCVMGRFLVGPAWIRNEENCARWRPLQCKKRPSPNCTPT